MNHCDDPRCSCRAKRTSAGGGCFPLVLLALALCSGGSACAGSLPEARASGARMRAGVSTAKATADNAARCQTLSDRHAFYGGAGKTLALLGGGAGLVTIATDDEKLQTVLAVGSMAAAAAAAGAVFVAESTAASFVRECP